MTIFYSRSLPTVLNSSKQSGTPRLSSPTSQDLTRPATAFSQPSTDFTRPFPTSKVGRGRPPSHLSVTGALRNEVSEMISAAVSRLISDNQEASRVRVIMADKDSVECEAFSSAFPDANIHICFFHTLHTFRQEINKSLEFLQRFPYCSSEQQYTTT